VAKNALAILLFLGGAGLLASIFQLFTAIPQVRNAILTIPARLLVVHPSVRHGRRQIRDLLLQVANRESVPPAMFGILVSHLTRATSWSEMAELSTSVAQRALRVSGATLVDRLRFPAEIELIQDYLRAVIREGRNLSSLRPVKAKRRFSDIAAGDGSDATFPELITSLSGALVFADASDTRSRVFDRAEVVCRGMPDLQHADRSCSFADALGHDDYDGQVLSVESVVRVRHPASPRFGLVIVASPSCYAETEARMCRRSCKHIRSEEDGSSAHEFAFTERDGAGWQIAHGHRRTNLLTGYVLLHTTDDRIVLAQRSGRTRNGLNVLSLSAGGVVEFDGINGDQDAAGSPDVRTAVIRETREELGVELIESSIRPVSVFLVNSLGIGSDGREEGQVVTTVLYAGSCGATFEQVVEAQTSRSDPATGSFEIAHLESVPLGSDPSELAHWLRENAERIDQHLLIGISYAMLLRFGPNEAAAELRKAFRKGPWWTVSTPTLDRRTCFPVGELCGRSTDALLRSVHPSWPDAIMDR
jgi:8-oxo-dGTP pyrophosphatase MutT (NUDIX family)